MKRQKSTKIFKNMKKTVFLIKKRRFYEKYGFSIDVTNVDDC
jgi:hypothetical protein